jgi:phage tail sheath protein FI
MMGGSSNTVTKYVIDNIAAPGGTYGRGDVVVFVSPQYTDVVDQPGQEVNKSLLTRNFLGSSSYAFMDSGWKKQFDKYNNKYRWIPLNGDVAGLCARTDQQRDAWFSPAGLNRGQIKNVTKLSWQPTKADRDNLYKNNINPVVTFKGEGTVLYGDKTLQTKPSAFDRINVRRLFIVLEKTISKAAKYSLFEFNDEFTRSQFVALVEPFLRDVKGRRGIYDFRVVCDETNNTPQVIDSNQFVGDIYVKPARSINFIHLNFVAVRTGVAFSEIVGKF